MLARNKLFKSIFTLVVAAAGLVVNASAQNEPSSKLELFAGYSAMKPYGSIRNNVDIPALKAGYSVSLGYTLTKNWTLTAEFSQHVGNDYTKSSVRSFAVGPQYNFHFGRVNPFAEMLVGVQRYRLKTGPAMIAGGGVNVDITKHLALRLVQADLDLYKYETSWPAYSNVWKSLRLQSGLLLHFNDADKTTKIAPPTDLFVGYSYYHPGGSGILPHNTYGPIYDLRGGYAMSLNVHLNKYVGLTMEGAHHLKNDKNSSGAFSMVAGPRLSITKDHITPFVELLMGMQHFGTADSFTVMTGGGLEVEVNRWLALRLIQADFVKSHNEPRGYDDSSWRGGRVQTGVVFHLFNGEAAAAVPPTVAVEVTPREAYACDPVKASAAASNFNAKRSVSYEWSGEGVKVKGEGENADVDTCGLQPGNYKVGVKAVDNGKGSKQQSAVNAATLVIMERPKPPAPKAPVVDSFSISPRTVKPGEPIKANCKGSSPDGRPVSYKFSASAGTVASNGSEATIDTASAPAGSLKVTCVVNDDRGLSASSSEDSDVVMPPPPPTSGKLNGINFPDAARPWRVDNAAKAILDEIALRLQREPSAKAAVVGYGKDSKKDKNLAARRALNTKQYLVEEKGVDPARIEVLQSSEDQTSADIWIIPEGASFSGTGASPVSPKVKADPSHPAGHVAAAAKKPAKKAKK